MKRRQFISLPLLALFLTVTSTAVASTTWYVNGVDGGDNNNCMSAQTPCKTIGHAISLAASGDSIMVAAATYIENLTIGLSLNVIGSGASTTIIDGGGVSRVVTIPNSSVEVNFANVTIRHGLARYGGGVYNLGTLTIIDSVVSGNEAMPPKICFGGCGTNGGGICNVGTLTVNNSTVTGNIAYTPVFRGGAFGGGIWNQGTVTINNSTVSQNSVRATAVFAYTGGGGVGNSGTATVNNSTIANNTGPGGIENQGTLTINNSTLSTNNIENLSGSTTLQNSIVANSSYVAGCSGTVISNGYNLSSDNTCSFSGPGDLNNTDPKLGTLGYYGGPTQTIPLLSGSPAIDAGNPSGCRDSQGNLLKTDQRGVPRPDPGDPGGCDMGAYESQSN